MQCKREGVSLDPGLRTRSCTCWRSARCWCWWRWRPAGRTNRPPTPRSGGTGAAAATTCRVRWGASRRGASRRGPRPASCCGGVNSDGRGGDEGTGEPARPVGARRIIARFPGHRVYVEPFAGGLSCLLNKPRSRASDSNGYCRRIPAGGRPVVVWVNWGSQGTEIPGPRHPGPNSPTVSVSATDTVGEFPMAVDRPELGQDGARWEGEIAAPDASSRIRQQYPQWTRKPE